MIFDCTGSPDLYYSSPRYLLPSGVFINIGYLHGIWALLKTYLSGTLRPIWFGGTPRRYIFFSTPPDRDAAVTMAQMINTGAIRVLVDSVWGMEDAQQAYARVATKRARGKVIVRVDAGLR